jgi:hypothetical protein
MSNVKIVRVLSGEEIIGNVETLDGASGAIKIKNATILIPTPEGKLMFAKWMPYADTTDGIVLEAKNIMFVLNAQKELEDHFTSVVVNGLVVPGKKVVEPISGSNLKLTV